MLKIGYYKQIHLREYGCSRFAQVFLLTVMGLCWFTRGALATDSVDKSGFLQQHCFECHGADADDGMLRLDQLPSLSTTRTSVEQWSQVLAAVEAGEMPPPDHARPAQGAIKQWVNEVVEAVAAADRIARGKENRALRRLNRREYENTLHDLLGIEVPLLDLLPEDSSHQGFDNVATGLSISSVLMEQYLEAANVAFDAVIRRIRPLPVQTRHVELMAVKENIDSVEQRKGGTIEAEGAFIKFTPGWPPARLDPVHPIEAGDYRCRVAVWPHDPSERTLAVAIYVGSLFGPQTRKFIGTFDVTGTPTEPRVIEFSTFMAEGDAIHVLPRIWPEHVTWRDKHEPRPGVGLAWAETEGPLDQSFPSEAQRQLFGDSPTITLREDQPIYMRNRKSVKLHVVESSQPEVDTERILRNFITRAFRRPVADEEMQPFVQLALSKLQAGRTFEQAVRAGITAVLCSPQFLLLNHRPQVDDYVLASRLSYFLWSSMPDDELLRLAATRSLQDPQVRYDQVERMLADSRSQRFIDNFTGQWLRLREIEFTTPDAKLYPEFDPLLQEAMLGETKLFFAHMLTEDLSVQNFIDSDWTFLNERLAKHYQIDGVKGHEQFRKVELPADCVRGGIMTHASLLKVTANGTTTSPILRGVWVLDNLLGRPAPPPPPGVPAVEPDIRGAVSIRDQLDKHRSLDACASCHKRIDPAGFALEIFDPIGGERDFYRSLGEGERIEGIKSYRRGPAIEVADKLADGRTFANFDTFRRHLAADREMVARGIATKLLIYGTGREIGLAERPQVDKVVQQSAKSDYGLRSIVHAIVDSDLFMSY